MQGVIDFFSEKIGRCDYMSNSAEDAFIKTENINYFEIKEKEEVAE